MKFFNLLLVYFCFIATTWGNTQRIAIVVGNNRADKSKPDLRYAQRDATEIAKVLRQLGGVEEIHLLLDRPAHELRATINYLNDRLKHTEQSTLFFFFFSGHADQEALLMGSSRFNFQELRNSLKRIPAQVCIAFIDACQSGVIARTKGGRSVSAIDVQFDNETNNRGRVFITSSAANEKSQESDSLQASFFTHYLVSGLKGAADDSGDRLVSLEEVYRFVYHQTVERTSTTLGGPQHPAYYMDLTGQGQIILTRLTFGQSYLVLPSSLYGRIQVRELPAGKIVGEVMLSRAQKPVRLALPPGAYEVRKLEKNSYLAQHVRVQHDAETSLESSLMKRYPLEPVVVKGDRGSPVTPNTYSLSYELQSSYLEQAGLIQGVRLGYRRAFKGLQLGGWVGYGHNSYWLSDDWAVNVNQLSIDIGAEKHLFPRWRIHPSLGLLTGMSWVWQRAHHPLLEPQLRSRPVFHYHAQVGIEAKLVRSLSFGLWGRVGQVILEKNDGFHAPFNAAWESGLLVNY